MTPDWAGTAGTVIAAVVLGALAAVWLWRHRRAVGEALAEWEADCADPDRLPVLKPGTDRYNAAFGLDAEIDRRLAERGIPTSWQNTDPAGGAR